MCTVKLVLDTNSSALASGYEFHQKLYIVAQQKQTEDWSEGLVLTYTQIFSPKKTQPKIDFSYYKYVPRQICLLICDTRGSPAPKSS